LNKEQFYHQSEFEFLKQALNIVEKGKSQIVCLYGEHGIGKTTIVNHLLQHHGYDVENLFHFNPIRKEENKLQFIRELFYYLWNLKNENTIRVKNYFYQHTRGEIGILENSNQTKKEQHIFRYYYSLIPEILKDFIFMVNQHRKLILVFENIEYFGEDSFQWLKNFLKGLNHPILVICTTSRKKIQEQLPPTVQSLEVKALNIKAAEKYILPFVKNNEINAKIINNFIFLKTGGNPLLIRSIVQLWFTQPNLYQNDVLDSSLLRESSVPVDWESLWQWYFMGVGDLRPVYYLYFMSKTGDLGFWEKLFKSRQLKEHFEKFIRDGILKINESLGKRYVEFCHPSLEEYIRMILTDKDMEEFLKKELDKNFIRKHLNVIHMNPVILTILAEELNIKGILKAVEKFKKQFLYNEIVQILSGLLLLPQFKSFHVSVKRNIYLHLADVLEKQNKLENALQYYQLILDLMPKNSEEEINIQLKVAHLLIKMDRVEDAAFILRHLLSRTKKLNHIRAEIYFLFGDIYYHNIQQEKAIEYYEETLKIITRNESTSVNPLKGKTLLKLASVYNSIGKHERAMKYLEQAQSIFNEIEEHAQSLKISLLKSYLWFNYYNKKEALKCILSEYRKIRSFYAPGVTETLEKQIAELYWLIGKWRYARGYYNRLFHFFSWRGDLYNASFMLGNMATIAKEIGEVGEAIQLEERALRMEHISRNILAMVYSFINLGHLYIMIGAHLTAQDQLNKALHLAEKNELLNEVIQARLLLSYLYMKQKSMEKSGQELKLAKDLIDMIDDEWGWINYLFYRSYYMIEKGNFSEAEASLQLFLKRTRHLVKYQCTGKFLTGLIHFHTGNFESAIDHFQEAKDIARSYLMPYWYYQIAYYEAKALDNIGKGIESEIALQEAIDTIITIANSLKDKILENQFLESRDVLLVLDEIKKIPQLNLKFVQWQIEKKNE
jgi:tetratricopeptide (TPR) repeat protein